MKERLKTVFYKTVKFITKKELIIDISGIILTPGHGGEKCKGNGKHKNWRGNEIECCCDECDYFIECFGENVGSK